MQDYLPAEAYYADEFVADQVGKYRSRDRGQWRERMDGVMRLVDECAPGRGAILDVACGVGAFTIECANRGHDVTGVDYSVHAVAAAQVLAKEAAVDAKFVHGDATALPFDDDTFDVAVASDIVEHLFDAPLVRMFRECKRVLKRGGRLIIHTTPTRFTYMMSPLRAFPLLPLMWLPESLLDRAIELYEKYPFSAVYKALHGNTWVELCATRGHCNCPSYYTLRAQLADAGLVVERYWAATPKDDPLMTPGSRVVERLLSRSVHARSHIWAVCRKD